MRQRWLLPSLLLLAASPLAAQSASELARAPADSATTVEPRLGPGTFASLFPIHFPAVPGRDLYWHRPRFQDWVADWTRAARARAATRSQQLWLAGPASRKASVDTIAYLPPPPARDTAQRGGLLSGAAAEYANLGMIIDGRGELGGAWTRYEPCDPGLQFNCNPSLFPQLKPDVQFGVRVGGTIADRIHVDVDYDQRREFDAANNIHVYYQGLEDEVLQRLEVGDVSIRLPPSRYLTQGIPAGNFGFKASGQLGPLDFQTVWAQQKGDVSTREFRLGGTRGPEGLVQDAELVLDDADYVKGQFFFLVDVRTLVGWPHLDVLALRFGDALPSVRPAQGSLQVFRDERPSLLNPQQQAQIGYFLADAEAAGGARRHSGMFRRLRPAEDYVVHSSGLWIVLRSPLRADEALAIAYQTDTGAVVGTLEPESSPAGTTPLLRLIRGPATIHQPGQPTWDYEMHHVYRLDSSNSVERNSIDLKISLGQLAAGLTFKDVAGQQVPLLRLFGLDEDAPIEQLDDAQIYQPARGSFGEVQQDAKIGGTFIVFPTLEPFATPPPVPSLRLTAEDTRQALGSDANSTIYRTPDPVAREAGARFRLNFKYRLRIEGLVSSFNLGAFGIREGSERITVDSQPLERGIDYTIDYDLGQVTLSNPQAIFGTNPDAEIRATWEQKALFQIAPTSVFGLNAKYALGARGELNFMGLYQSEKTLTPRAQLGIEPGSIFLGGASGRLDLGAGWLDHALEHVPALRAGGASAINLTGEMALSLPNPNTRGDTYLDDFEGSDEIPLGLQRSVWRLGSRPEDPTGATDVLPLPVNVQTAAGLTWQHDFLDGGNIVGPLRAREHIDQQINSVGNALPEPVLWLTFGDSARAPSSQRAWRSITTVLSTTGRDMSRSEFLEFYVAAPRDRDFALVVDVGGVGEDAYFFDKDGRTGGTVDGRAWGLGVLDQEANLAEREIWGQEQDARGLWDQSCQAERGKVYPLGDARANCTGNNGLVDTEDLDGNGAPDLRDGAHFRYLIKLDGSSRYLVRGPTGTGTAFTLYRIPLRGPDAVPINGATDGTWRFIKHLRITLTGAPVGVDTLVLARMRIAGSRWSKRDVHGIQRSLTSDQPGLGATTTNFQVGAVSSITDGSVYSSPPGVRDQLQDPTSVFGAGATEINEKALRLKYDALEADDRAEVYFRYAQQPRNLLNYRALHLWAVARRGDWGPQGSERLVLRAGTDPRNFYIYRTPLRPAASGAAVRTEDWVNLVVDFERWFQLKAEAEQKLIEAPLPAGQQLVVWSEDSTYAVVLEDRARAPNLAAIRELGFAVHNAGGSVTSGEVWINELRLGGAVQDAGFAGHLNLDVRAGDFLTANASYAQQGALFRQLNQDASYQTTGDFSISSTAQVGQLLPAGWGVELPVSVSHVRSGLDPTFLERSDVRAEQLEGLRETGSERTRLGVSLRKRTPTANPLLSVLVDGVTLRLNYNTAASTSVNSKAEASGIEGGVSYQRQLGARELDIVPGFVESVLRALAPRRMEDSPAFRRLTDAKLRWSPQALSFSSNYYDQDSRSFRYDQILELPGDTAVRPITSPRRGLENNARLTLHPFQSLTADFDVTSSRDLLPSSQATQQPREQRALDAARTSLAGADLGWETSRSMGSQITFRPEVTPWLRPGLTYSARFQTARNPSYIELEAQGDDTTAVLQRNFQGDRQLTRTLLFEPAGFVQALLGPAAADASGARRALERASRAWQQIDLNWSTSLSSQFERETVAPGIGYQFGLGSLSSFRRIGDDTATTALTRSNFRARSGVRLPFQTRINVGYGESQGQLFDLRGGRRDERQRNWPDVQFQWDQIPLPTFTRGVLTRASLTTGYQHSEREDVLGEQAQERGSEQTSIPLQLHFVLPIGLVASYTGSLTSGSAIDPTGESEQRAATHALQLQGTFQAPASLREKFAQPIQAALSYNYQADQQCRVRAVGEVDSPCVPFIDLINRRFSVTLDTNVQDLNVGFQMSFTDRKSFVGTRTGSSQFQLGLFGQFHFSAGDFTQGR